MTIAVPGVVKEIKGYRGFIISWQEPPLTSAKWTANIESESPHLAAFLRHGVEIIDGRNRVDMVARAKSFIDNLFG